MKGRFNLGRKDKGKEPLPVPSPELPAIARPRGVILPPNSEISTSDINMREISRFLVRLLEGIHVPTVSSERAEAGDLRVLFAPLDGFPVPAIVPANIPGVVVTIFLIPTDNTRAIEFMGPLSNFLVVQKIRGNERDFRDTNMISYTIGSNDFTANSRRMGRLFAGFVQFEAAPRPMTTGAHISRRRNLTALVPNGDDSSDKFSRINGVIDGLSRCLSQAGIDIWVGEPKNTDIIIIFVLGNTIFSPKNVTGSGYGTVVYIHLVDPADRREFDLQNRKNYVTTRSIVGIAFTDYFLDEKSENCARIQDYFADIFGTGTVASDLE